VSENKITQIWVKDCRVGLVGLAETLAAVAEAFAGRSDEDCREELLRRIAARNYVPASAREGYGRALLRELYHFLGRPVPEEADNGLKVAVLGPGCPQCDRLAQEVMAVLGELKSPVDFAHVTDIKEIGRSGVLGTPALRINERVVCVGRVPPRANIRGWLEEAMDKK